MMKNIRILLVIFLICLGVFLGFAIGIHLSASIEKDTSAISCPNIMAEIIQSAQGDVYKIDDPNYTEPATHFLVKYSVKGDEITNPLLESAPADLKDEQANTNLQKEVWGLFTSLIPPENRRMVSQYDVFTDGFENTLAAVDQLPDSPANWSVQIDIADLENKDLLLFTLVHEYAHILTLDDTQVLPDQELLKDPYNKDLLDAKAAACPNYAPGNGCSKKDSYINSFYSRFWVDINTEWQKIDALQYDDNQLPYYDGLYKFYQAHRDQFVDDYATTHPDEDIAESFAYFVFSPRPQGNSIKGQKILFFYQYPELVRLRGQILSDICTRSK